MFKLCYIDNNKAWFTDNFEKQWGDDWNDKPYQDNAGKPYNEWSELVEDNDDFMKRKYKSHPINLKAVMFETNNWSTKFPSDLGRFSVQQINKRHCRLDCY